MQAMTGVFNRIQVRLFAAYGVLVAGMLFMWYSGVALLNQFADQVSERIDVLYEGGDLGMRLQASVLDQIAVGEHYLVSGHSEDADEFRRLGTQVHDLKSQLHAASRDSRRRSRCSSRGSRTCTPGSRSTTRSRTRSATWAADPRRSDRSTGRRPCSRS